jgi:hypothetical protein
VKKSITKITCSQTFFFKSRCKFCVSGPKYVFYILNKLVSEQNLYKIKEFYEAQVSTFRPDNFYMHYSVDNRSFSASYLFDSSSCALRKLPVPNKGYKQTEDKITTAIECSCGRTVWTFTDSNREHIKNRKCSLVMDTKDIVSLYKVMF